MKRTGPGRPTRLPYPACPAMCQPPHAPRCSDQPPDSQHLAL